ncbi:MAG TPA: hypothetical protein VMS92_21690 [Mycobacterium sp.]|nr:hypothetical protein [Mycobacterium sp.]
MNGKAALALLIPSADGESAKGKVGKKDKAGAASKKLRLSTCKDILAAETPEDLDTALTEWMGYYEGDEAE